MATFNILHGRSTDDGQVVTDRLVEACASLDADVLCLQEVDRGQARSGGVDQAAAVAGAMGARDWRFAPALVGEPGGRWRAATDGDASPSGSTEPGYGVALVSRRPVREWRVLRLRAAPVRAPVAVPGGRGRFVLLRDEPRVVLAAQLDGMIVATTHLSFVPGYNLVQLRRAVAWLATLSTPVLLAGDFNVPGSLPAWASRWRPLARTRTYPAGRPSMQVDHILATGPVSAVQPAEVHRMPLSDHLALAVAVASEPCR